MKVLRPAHILYALFLLLGMLAMDAKAQFHELELLPWCPVRPVEQSAQGAGSVLESLNDALLAGQYKEVVERLYPQAISQGYQRNANLYNQTRRALRNLLQEEGGEAYWPTMERLYHDRYANIGQEEYEYRNTLETRMWCDEQLKNERLLMLSTKEGMEMDCYDVALQLLVICQGQTDPIRVTQGLFVPLNRAHAHHPTQTKDYLPKYQEVLRWAEATESYMQIEHPEDYLSYYSGQSLAIVKEESQRQLSADMALAELESRRQQQQEELRAHYDSINKDSKAQRLYAEALSCYRNRQYAEAYAHVNEVLSAENMREAHILKSNILQAAANASKEMKDKVAFWCAAYEAGQGYVDKQVLNQLVSALRNNLFMSGLAGTVHSTQGPIRIRQRIWTIDQLRKM